MNYDVIIIGAGPGGIFTAYELLKADKGLKIGVFEKGGPLNERNAPSTALRSSPACAARPAPS